MDPMQVLQQMPAVAVHTLNGMDHDHHDRDPYLVKSVVHASQILAAFRNTVEVLPLKEIVARCGLPKSMVFRLLYTMTTCNIVEKVDSNRYHLKVRPHDELPDPPVSSARRRRTNGARQVPGLDAAQIGLSSD